MGVKSQKIPEKPQFLPWDAWVLFLWLSLCLLRPQEVYPLIRLWSPAILGAVLLGRWAQTPRLGQLQPLAWPGLALLAFPLWAGLISHLHSPSWHVGARLVGTWAQGAAVALWGLHLIHFAPDRERVTRRILWALAAVIALLCLWSLHSHFVVRPQTLDYLESRLGAGDLSVLPLLGAMADGRLRGTLGDPNHMGLVAGLGTVTLWGLALVRGEPWQLRSLALTLSLPTVLTLGLSSSRGALLGFLVGLAPLALLLPSLRSHRRRSAAWGLSLGAAAIVAVGLLVAFTPALRERLGNLSTVQERLGYWAIAWKVFGMHPILGSGAGSFTAHYPLLRPDWLGTAQLVHSLPLQALAETGLIGTALLMWPLALCCRVRFIESETKWVLMAAVTVFGVTSLSSHSPLFREIWLLGSLLLGLLLGLSAKTSDEPSMARWPLVALAACLAGAAILCFPPDLRESRGDISLERADLLRLEGRPREALESVRRAAEVNDRDDHHLVACARELLAIGAAWPNLSESLAGEADELLGQAQSLNSLRPSILSTRAEIASRRHSPEEAITLQTEAIALHPAEWTLKVELVRHLVQAQRHEEALTVAREIQADPRTDERADRAVADALRAMGRHAAAAETLRAALIAMPHPPPSLWLQVAQDEHAAGNAAAAMEAAREAGRLAPNSPEIQGQVRRYLSLGRDG